MALSGNNGSQQSNKNYLNAVKYFQDVLENKVDQPLGKDGRLSKLKASTILEISRSTWTTQERFIKLWTYFEQKLCEKTGGKVKEINDKVYTHGVNDTQILQLKSRINDLDKRNSMLLAENELLKSTLVKYKMHEEHVLSTGRSLGLINHDFFGKKA